MASIPILASVALLADLPEHGLSRGQIGTVVEHLRSMDEQALLVEFADDHGQTYAIADLKPDQLVVLHRGSSARREPRLLS
jgi:hypothetical protein